MSEELKPCPFCGCRATSITDAENVRITGSHSAACPFRDVDVIVDSRDAWNTRAELAAIKAGKGDAVAWRDHSVNYAKGEKCPATIETLHAAWDRDQELLLDQKNVISKLKETINQLRQKRSVPPAPADARLVPVELLERVCVDRCYPAGHTMSIRAIDELRALLAQSQEVKS